MDESQPVPEDELRRVPEDEEEAQDSKPLVGKWRGREFELKIPSGSQLMVWNRVASQFGKMGEGEFSDDEFRKALNRLGDVVFGVFANPDDVEWLEDEILADRIVDSDLLELFVALRDALSIAGEVDEPKNRAQRRSAARLAK